MRDHSSQIGTVHFARMAIVGDYLVFSSHFDGDMIAYLDDFFSFTAAERGLMKSCATVKAGQVRMIGMGS